MGDNGFLQGSITNPSNITLHTIYSSINAKGKSIRVFNKDLSKAEIEGLDKFLASIYPEHETTAIGSQAWLTSNHIGNVTSDGFVIPEVQGNDAASNPELITNAADRDFSSDTGFWTKGAAWSIVGGQAVKSIAESSTFNANVGQVAGKVYRIVINVASVTAGSFNIILGGSVASNTISAAGTYTMYLRTTNTGNLFITSNTTFLGAIESISVKEVGWADAQSIYDFYISIGQSLLESSKSASMWCKYNNSDDNAAVYGYQLNWWAAYLLSINPPKGLRYPTELDSDQLRTTLGGSVIAAGKLKKEGLTYWNSPNTGASNESGFTAIGGGVRLPSDIVTGKQIGRAHV